MKSIAVLLWVLFFVAAWFLYAVGFLVPIAPQLWLLPGALLGCACWAAIFAWRLRW
jgi:hypothetical protein